jgi:GNAT superfamily N-acetyltransferase
MGAGSAAPLAPREIPPGFSASALIEDMMEIAEIVDAEQKSSAVAEIIKTLPEWFGIPESNERYVREAATKDVFAAYDDLNQPVGLIALRYHFQRTAEIWWMGVKPAYHRRGMGTPLFQAAKSKARQKGVPGFSRNDTQSMQSIPALCRDEGILRAPRLPVSLGGK